MHRILILILIFSLSCCAKSDPTKFKKKNTIPKDDFVSILVEMHVMDAMITSPEFYQKYSFQDTVEVYGSIFKKYGYTREEFDYTVSAYTKRPVRYDKIYNDVLMKLNFAIDTLQKQSPKFDKDTGK